MGFFCLFLNFTACIVAEQLIACLYFSTQSTFSVEFKSNQLSRIVHAYQCKTFPLHLPFFDLASTAIVNYFMWTMLL